VIISEQRRDVFGLLLDVSVGESFEVEGLDHEWPGSTSSTRTPPVALG
jgi:hypothetical protein